MGFCTRASPGRVIRERTLAPIRREISEKAARTRPRARTSSPARNSVTRLLPVPSSLILSRSGEVGGAIPDCACVTGSGGKRQRESRRLPPCDRRNLARTGRTHRDRDRAAPPRRRSRRRRSRSIPASPALRECHDPPRSASLSADGDECVHCGDLAAMQPDHAAVLGHRLQSQSIPAHLGSRKAALHSPIRSRRHLGARVLQCDPAAGECCGAPRPTTILALPPGSALVCRILSGAIRGPKSRSTSFRREKTGSSNRRCPTKSNRSGRFASSSSSCEALKPAEYRAAIPFTLFTTFFAIPRRPPCISKTV